MGKNRNFFARWTPAIYWSLVSKPVSQDIQSICYCLHPGIFRLDTRDLLVAVVPISISSKYLYLYLALKVLTKKCTKCDLKQCNVTNSSLHHSRNETRSSVTRYNEILRDFNAIRNYMQKFVLHCKGVPTFRNLMFAKISGKNARY